MFFNQSRFVGIILYYCFAKSSLQSKSGKMKLFRSFSTLVSDGHVKGKNIPLGVNPVLVLKLRDIVTKGLGVFHFDDNVVKDLFQTVHWLSCYSRIFMNILCMNLCKFKSIFFKTLNWRLLLKGYVTICAVTKLSVPPAGECSESAENPSLAI